MSKMIQIRNVPTELHRKLKARAAMAGMSLSEFLLNEAARAAERPSMEELRKRIAALPPIDLTESVANAIRAEREIRDRR